MTPKIYSPHDTIFKQYYGDPTNAAGFLRHNLPLDLAAKIDFRTLTPVKDSFVSEDFEKFFADLVFQCTLTDGQDASIYILLEHKSVPSPACAVQLLRYMVMLWEDALRSPAPSLPVVIPIVIYHGSSPWTGKQIKDLFPNDPVLAEFLPDFRIIVYDLPRMPKETIKGDLASNLILLLFKAMKADVPLVHVADLIKLLIKAHGVDGAQGLIKQMLYYVVDVDRTITKTQVEIELAKLPEGEEVMRSVAGILSPEAYEKGVQVGEERAMEKGRGEGASGVLVNLVNLKFGPLSEANSLKIRSIQDVGTINGLCMNLLTASSIDEFMFTVDKVLDA